MLRILPLTGHHDKARFDCGNPVLNNWLAAMASQHRKKGISTTYVAVETDVSPEIFGFYAINIVELRNDQLPENRRNKLPQRVPAFRIGRMAVSKSHQGQGLGRLLLANAVSRLTRLSEEVGGLGIVIDAKPDAIGFYRQYGFEQLADHPAHLFMPF